jgi:hypothetical protein
MDGFRRGARVLGLALRGCIHDLRHDRVASRAALVDLHSLLEPVTEAMAHDDNVSVNGFEERAFVPFLMTLVLHPSTAEAIYINFPGA